MEDKNTNKEIDKKEIPKHQGKIKALDNLSLGISMVVAVALGTGLGILVKDWTGYTWTLWVGIFWGIAAAFLNVYKAYKRAQKEFEGLENDPRYAHRAKYGTNTSDDED